MNNAVFGKTMEDVRGRIDIRFATDEAKFVKYVNQSEYKKVIRDIGNENWRMIEMNKSKVVLDKPIFCGQAILDISKKHMYDFYYNVMKPKYGDDMKLVLTDTDSFVLVIKTDDFYDDMYKMRERFDTSNYPKDHKLFTNERKKRLGFFKDELCDNDFNAMEKVIAMRNKVYAYTFNGKEKKTLKGISAVVKDKNIKFAEYEQALFERKIISKKVKAIRSFGCVNHSITQSKKALSPYDDKRYIFLDDGISSYAYGHYAINN